jgi:FkbM family methyltransferase
MGIGDKETTSLFNRTFVLRVFKLFPPALYHRIRRMPLLGQLGRRALDAVIRRPGLRPVRILGGPLSGMVLDLDPRDHKEMAVGHYEPVVEACIERYLRPGDLAFDVGAHLGYMTICMARLVNATGKVVAFEPDPDVIRILNSNLARNNHTITAAVTTQPTAIGATTGQATFTPGSDNSTGRLTEGGSDLLVSAITLDEATTRFGTPQLIKMDIEGGELDALKGASELLKIGQTTFVIELHSPELDRSCTALLQEHGWTCSYLREPGASLHLVAIPPQSAIK